MKRFKVSRYSADGSRWVKSYGSFRTREAAEGQVDVVRNKHPFAVMEIEVVR